MLLLCGLVAILGSLQGGAAYECSTLHVSPLWTCPSGNSSIICIYGKFLQTHGSLESWRAAVYILIDLAPLVVYLPLLILFNGNLAAGPAQSFVFFYQALPAAIPIDIFRDFYPAFGGFWWGLFSMQNPINDLGINFLPTDNRLFPRILPYIALEYCKLAAVLAIAVTAVLLIKCVDCPCVSWRRPWAKLRRSVRHFRERRAQKGTVLNGLCSIAILTYGFVIQQSFSLLQPTKSCGNVTHPYPTDDRYCPFYCTEMEYFSGYHLPYVIVAVPMLLLALSFPLLLLYYPAVPALVNCITKKSIPLTCHKLAPVFDVFQSAYKPKLRFFAALPLLYRILIWLIISTPPAFNFAKLTQRHIYVTFAFIVILAIHSLVQPYKKPTHNYIETLYLLNLVILSMIILSLFTFIDPTTFAVRISLIVAVSVSANLPIVVGAAGFLWKCKCSKRCRAACCKKLKQLRTGSVERTGSVDRTGSVERTGAVEVTNAQAMQMLPSEVYLDMSEVELSIEDSQ